MPTTRVNHDATQDFVGAKVGTLRVTGIAARAGNERRYTVRCEKCQSQNTAKYSQLRHGTAKCLNANCGKPASRRELLAESRRIAAQKQAELDAAQNEASSARMAAETEGYERPTRYAPVPAERTVMTDRDRRSLREFREEQDAEQRRLDAPRLEAERRAAEEQEAAEQQRQRREEGQRAYWRESVLSGPDLKLYVTPELMRASLPTVEAVNNHNLAEIEKFIEATPEFLEYKLPANADAILQYFRRNGVVIFDAAMLKAAFIRLRDLGILVKRPASQPQPVQQPKRVNLSAPVESEKQASPKSNRGRDQRTGEIRDFSDWEVRNMGADEYKRTFAVAPTVSELFTVMSGSR